MNVEELLHQLAQGTQALVRTSSPANVFKALLDASRAAAPRASVLLLRQGNLTGWGSVGYTTDVANAQRSFRAPADEGWLGDVVSRRGGGSCVARAGGSHEPDFGQPRAADAVGYALCVDGRPIAVLVGERGSDEPPWFPGGLALIASVAEGRLELGLARRRADAASGAATVAAPIDGTPADPPVTPEVQPAPQASNLDAARRYARLVATDIRLYNEEAVMLGRRHGDLTDRLGEHLSRGRETFMRRHGNLGETAIDLLREAYVQVLAAGDGELIPPGRMQT